jgi:glutamate transport system substrate-binding protein
MRTLRTGRLAALLLTSGLALAACGGGDSDDTAAPAPAETTFAAGTTMATLQQRGSLKVGVKFDQPLFGEKGLSGGPEGLDVEMARIVAGKLGIPADKIEFQEAASKNREPFLEQGTVDLVIATYTINDTRKQIVDFAGPYYVTGQSLMVRKDDTTINSKADLAGKTVCSVTGSTPLQRIRTEAPQATVIEFDTYGKCATAVENKQADAVTTDEAILLGLVSKNEAAFKVVGEQFSKEPYGIGLKKGDTAFRTFLNDTIEAAYADGSYEAALKKTVGTVQDDLPAGPPVERY